MKLSLRSTAAALVFGLLFTSASFAQFERVGGPYTVDGNTILLLHFDDTLNVGLNDATVTDDAIIEAKTSASYALIPHSADSLMDLGTSLYLENDSRSDSVYIRVPDDDDLDLVGSWTIEGWCNVFTFGTGADDWRWVPRLLMKPGNEVFWQPNYWVELWGDTRQYQVGFLSSSPGNGKDGWGHSWPSVSTAENSFVPGQWAHLAFLRDTDNWVMAALVHNQDRELVWYGTMDLAYYGYDTTTPVTNEQDFHSGWAGPGSADSWVHGFIDELRISDVVRNFAVPPVVSGVTVLSNQTTDATEYVVEASMVPWVQGSVISAATLYYSVDGGDTYTDVTMTDQGGDIFQGAIPAQTAGTIVRYYVVGEDDNGLSARKPEGSDLSFGVFTPNSQTLELDFEGDLTDGSAYGHEAVAPDAPNFVADAKVGSQAVEFPENPPASTDYDSSYLYIESPFLTSEEFTVDYWFKYEADTALPYIRMIIRTNATSGSFHVDQNYYVRTDPDFGLRAQYIVNPDSASRTKDNVTLEMVTKTDTVGGEITEHRVWVPNQWYRAIFQRSQDAAVFELRNENDEAIYRVVDNEDIALNPPLYPAQGPFLLGWARNSWDEIPRRFVGKMDGVNIFNYAAYELDTTDYWNVPATKVGELRDGDKPLSFALGQNYPNPFNPTTTIDYTIPEASNVTLEVYDVMGAKVRTLVSGAQSAGTHTATWDAHNDAGVKLASGAYFYRLQAGDKVKTMKMMLLK